MAPVYSFGLTVNNIYTYDRAREQFPLLEPPLSIGVSNLSNAAWVIAKTLDLNSDNLYSRLYELTQLDHGAIIPPLVEYVSEASLMSMPDIPRQTKTLAEWSIWLRAYLFRKVTGYMMEPARNAFGVYSQEEYLQWSANFAWVVANRLPLDGYFRAENGFSRLENSLIEYHGVLPTGQPQNSEFVNDTEVVPATAEGRRSVVRRLDFDLLPPERQSAVSRLDFDLPPPEPLTETELSVLANFPVEWD
jgi:hypothetical protein